MICYFLEFHHSCCGVTAECGVTTVNLMILETLEGCGWSEISNWLVTSHLDWQKRRLMCSEHRDQSVHCCHIQHKKRWLKGKGCIINLSFPAQSSTESTPVSIDMLIISARLCAPTLLLLQSLKKVKDPQTILTICTRIWNCRADDMKVSITGCNTILCLLTLFISPAFIFTHYQRVFPVLSLRFLWTGCALPLWVLASSPPWCNTRTLHLLLQYWQLK